MCVIICSIVILQRAFVNSVSASLIAQPNYKNKDDPTRTALLELADAIVSVDAEFILKVCKVNLVRIILLDF